MQNQGKSYINVSSNMLIRQLKHTYVTCNQVLDRHRRCGNRDLAPFLQANQDGQEQADGQDEACGIPFWKKRQGAFVHQKAQDTEQDEMSQFIPTWKSIDPINEVRVIGLYWHQSQARG